MGIRHQIPFNEIDAVIANKLVYYTNLKGMSARQLSEAMGGVPSANQINKYKPGKRKDNPNKISASMLYRISEALQVPIENFYYDDPSINILHNSVAMTNLMRNYSTIANENIGDIVKRLLQEIDKLYTELNELKNNDKKD